MCVSSWSMRDLNDQNSEHCEQNKKEKTFPKPSLSQFIQGLHEFTPVLVLSLESDGFR